MRLWLIIVLCQALPWLAIRNELSRGESANGKYKIHVNANRTIDCGRFQINSRHFVEKDRVGIAFDSIFVKFGVGIELHNRVAAAITDDSLNEELAKKLYQIQGLKAWISHNP